MSRVPLMAKATAVWLVENTTVTFKQIAEFCHLHELEVKGIADGDVAQHCALCVADKVPHVPLGYALVSA